MNKEIDSNFFLSFPTNKFAGDISPYKIFVVILLKEYLRKQPIKHKDNDGGLNPDEKPEFPALNYDPDYRRKISMLLLKLTQISDMSYKDLHRLLVDGKYKVEEGHLKAFEESICTLSQRGIEVLFKLSKIMDELITETQTKNNSPMIHQSSCIGLFFRRILVHLEKMSFQELMSLHANINTYYETGMRELGLPYETTTKSNDTKEPNKPKWSSKQAEIFIAQQSALLENDEVKSLNPKELQNKIDEIVHTYTPLSSRAYFLSYLNNVRIRDFPNCLEALHRSFDKNVGKPALDNPETTSNKTQFQYSLLNLAILHTIFEHNGEALKCLKECIMIAQETGDRVCLQLAQLWLCLLDKKNFQLSEKNIANKTEKTLVRSVSLNIQSLVKVAAISGYLPSKLFDVLVKSDILNCQHSIMNLIANCIAERAALWNLYGKHEMASLITQQLLNSNLKVMEKTHNGEGLCLALCSQTLWLSLQGEAAAVDVLLSRIKQRFQRYPISKNWMLVEYYTQSTRAIHHEKWSDGFEACDNLYSIDKNLSILQRAALNLARGNRSTALCLLDLLLEDDNIDSLCMIRVMTMQVRNSQFQPHVDPINLSFFNCRRCA